EGEGEEEEAEDEEEEGEDARATKRPRGLTLIFDVVWRFLTPLRPAPACSRRHAAAPLPHTFRTEAAATIMVPNRIARVAFFAFREDGEELCGDDPDGVYPPLPDPGHVFGGFSDRA
ncbi:MAG: hypothetical protein ACUVQH_15250, partial [Thermogutta sp.]